MNKELRIKQLKKDNKDTLMDKIIQLENRVKDLEDHTDDIEINNVRVKLGLNRFDREFRVNIYKPVDSWIDDEIRFEFSDSIKIIPGSANGFSIELLDKK